MALRQKLRAWRLERAVAKYRARRCTCSHPRGIHHEGRCLAYDVVAGVSFKCPCAHFHQR